jgi:hypothetical protein
MRRLAPAAVAAAALVVPAAGAAADGWATGTARGRTLTLRLHYEMVCGLPGRGPAVVRVPVGFRLGVGLTALADGRRRPVRVSGRAASIRLPGPPQVTCLSIGMGVLTLELRGVALPRAGTYAVRASLPGRSFVARVRVRT